MSRHNPQGPHRPQGSNPRTQRTEAATERSRAVAAWPQPSRVEQSPHSRSSYDGPPAQASHPHGGSPQASNPDKKDMRKLQRSQRDRWTKPVVRRGKVLQETARTESARETGTATGGLKIVHFGC